MHADRNKSPTRVDLSALPHFARVAFASRYARRVQPLFSFFWPGAFPRLVSGQNKALVLVEELARTGSQDFVREACEACFENTKSAINCAHMSATQLTWGKAAFEVAETIFCCVKSSSQVILLLKSGFILDHDLINEAVRGAEIALDSLTQLPPTCRSGLLRAMWQDVDVLTQAASRGCWKDSTPVPPESLGAVWPDGLPEGWPEQAAIPTGPADTDWQKPNVFGMIPLTMPEQFLDIIAKRNEAITLAQDPILKTFQGDLDQLEGQNFGFEMNQRIVNVIQQTVDRLGVAFLCPVQGCERPARLRCHKPGRSQAGLIQFEHYFPAADQDSKPRMQKHGGATHFQKLRLCREDGSPILNTAHTDTAV